MPHKHRRRQINDVDYNLPPTHRALSLPVTIAPKAIKKRANCQSYNDQSKDHNNGGSKKNISREKAVARFSHDDTPRYFKRLMSFASGKRVFSGLDNGNEYKSNEKSKTYAPTIQPGESMSDFSARVNTEIPITTDVKHMRPGKDSLGIKVWKTRKELKLQKLYGQWREENQRLKERMEDQLEAQAERELDHGLTSIPLHIDAVEYSAWGGHRKRRRRNYIDDPWSAIKANRESTQIESHIVKHSPLPQNL